SAGVSGGLPERGAQVSESRQKVQLTFWDAEENPVVTELRKLDLTTMTPIEALTVLYQLQKRAAQYRSLPKTKGETAVAYLFWRQFIERASASGVLPQTYNLNEPRSIRFRGDRAG